MRRCQLGFAKGWWICILVPDLSQRCSISDGEIKQHLIPCVQLSALTSPQFCLISSELSAIYLTNIWLLHGLPTQLFTSGFVHTLTWHYWLASGHCGLLPECHCWVLNQKRSQRELIVTGTKEPNYLCCKPVSIYPVCSDVKEVRKLFLGNKFKECAKSRRTGIHRSEVVQTCSGINFWWHKCLKMCNRGKSKLY